VLEGSKRIYKEASVAVIEDPGSLRANPKLPSKSPPVCKGFCARGEYVK